MSAGVFAVVSIIVAFAAFVQGTTGFGFALIVAPVLAIAAPDLMPVSLLILMLPLNVYVAWRERSSLDRTGAGWITLGRVAGTFGGVWVLTMLSTSELNVLIGASTVAAALATLAMPSFAPGARALVAAGVVTGVTETATGIGGPPLALVYQHRRPAILRSTIAFCFLVGEIVSLAFLCVAGRTTTAQAIGALMLITPAAIGAAASRYVHRRVDGRALRVFVLLFAVASGIVLVARAI